MWSADTGIRIISDRDPVLGRNGWRVRALPDLRGKRVAELGGGGSYFLVGIAKQGALVTAVDYSEVGIELTKKIFAANRVVGDAICADVFNWHPAVRFDAVLHFGLIEHFEDPVPLLRVCDALLAKEGQVIFVMPNMEAWGARFWRAYSPANWSVHVFHSDERMRAACEAAGLKLTRTFHFGWPLIQIAPWESDRPILRLLSFIQRLTNIASPLYRYGTRSISCYRGFVAVRAAEADGGRPSPTA